MLTSSVAAVSAAQNVIKLTTEKTPGEIVYFIVGAVGSVSIEGVKEAYSPEREQYTLKESVVTITGNVTTLKCSGEYTDIDVTKSAELLELECPYTGIKTLDVSQNKKLVKLQ